MCRTTSEATTPRESRGLAPRKDQKRIAVNASRPDDPRKNAGRRAGSRRWRPIPVASLAVLALAGLAQAQGAPGASAPALPPVLPPTAAPAPKAPPAPKTGAGTFTLRKLRFKGNERIPTDELEELVRDLVGKPVDLADLREAAARVTEEYRRRGFDLARAYLPAQEIANGIVTIEVLEGTVGEVRVSGNQSYSDAFIERFLRAPLGGGALTSEGLTRGLLTLNEEFKDLEVKASLERGKEVGQVDVKAEVTDRFPLSATLFYNNYGSEFVSRHRFGITLDWVNAGIPGSVLSATGLVGERPGNLVYGSGAYVLPLGSWGTKLGVSGSFGDFEVGGDVRALQIRGDQLSLGGFLSHPFIKRRALRVTAEMGIQIKEARFFLLGQSSSRDRIRYIYLGGRADVRHWGGRTFAGLTVAQGLGRFLGGLGKDDPRSSRRNADNQFTRFNVNLGHVQPIADWFSVIGQVSGQWSSESLVSNEEWQLGGEGSVRGYAPGAQTGDHGYQTSLELRFSPLEDRELLQLLAFVDHGGAFRQQTFIGQKRQDYLTGAGVGFRSHFEAGVEGDLGLDIGWPIRPHDNVYNEAPVIYASVSIRF